MKFTAKQAEQLQRNAAKARKGTKEAAQRDETKCKLSESDTLADRKGKRIEWKAWKEQSGRVIQGGGFEMAERGNYRWYRES